MDEKETLIDAKVLYEGPIFDIETQAVQLASGQTAKRDIVRHVPAIAVLAFQDSDHIILERQWRATIGDFILEIPAGKLDQRDINDPIHAVRRELNEELRMHTDDIHQVMGFYETVGFSDAYMHLYTAHDLQPVPEDEQLPRDVGETMDLVTVSYDEMLAMFQRGELNDQKTITAFLYWAFIRGN